MPKDRRKGCGINSFAQPVARARNCKSNNCFPSIRHQQYPSSSLMMHHRHTSSSHDCLSPRHSNSNLTSLLSAFAIVNYSACRRKRVRQRRRSWPLPQNHHGHPQQYYRRVHDPPSWCTSTRLDFSTSDENDENYNESSRSGGVYVDLDSIPSFTSSSADIETSFSSSCISDPTLENLDNNNEDTPSSIITTTRQTQTITTIEEWRSHHWIVLIDDEPSIRLAIGDYLHSMGYSCVTACDGPMAFLEMMLWSASWSLSLSQHNDNNENGNAVEEDENEGDNGGNEDVISCPPWIVEDKQQKKKWRLPNCIISDIRMPGGIDGVQLLELLRRRSSSTPTANGDDDHDKQNQGETTNGTTSRKKTKKAKSAQRGDTSAYDYDSKDEFDLLDEIVAGQTTRKQSEKRMITTPTDQAIQYLDAINGCIEYFEKEQQSNIEMKHQQQQQQQYPSSLQQVPVILLTAKAMPADRVVGYKAGANGYLPKPFRPEELLGMVDNLMRKQERQLQTTLTNTNNNNQGADGASSGMEDLTPDEAAEITAELAEIKKVLKAKLDQRGTEQERVDREHLQTLLPEAMWMLKTGERRKKVFTKDHIRAILTFCFDVCPPKNNTRRDDLLDVLEMAISNDEISLETM